LTIVKDSLGECKECKDCKMTIVDNCKYRGCFHPPYKGKWVLEIEHCPKEEKDK